MHAQVSADFCLVERAFGGIIHEVNAPDRPAGARRRTSSYVREDSGRPREHLPELVMMHIPQIACVDWLIRAMMRLPR